MVGFRAGDPDLLVAMAKDEAEAGNATGAESLLSIADRMQMIMDRSEAKMSKKLELMPEAAAAPDPANPFGQDEAVAKKWWPFQHESLLAKGGSVWSNSEEPGPKAARGPTSVEAGSFITWKFRIDELAEQGVLCL